MQWSLSFIVFCCCLCASLGDWTTRSERSVVSPSSPSRFSSSKGGRQNCVKDDTKSQQYGMSNIAPRPQEVGEKSSGWRPQSYGKSTGVRSHASGVQGKAHDNDNNNNNNNNNGKNNENNNKENTTSTSNNRFGRQQHGGKNSARLRVRRQYASRKELQAQGPNNNYNNNYNSGYRRSQQPYPNNPQQGLYGPSSNGPLGPLSNSAFRSQRSFGNSNQLQPQQPYGNNGFHPQRSFGNNNNRFRSQLYSGYLNATGFDSRNNQGNARNQYNANSQAYATGLNNRNNQGYARNQYNTNSQAYSAANYNANSQGYGTLGLNNNRNNQALGANIQAYSAAQSNANNQRYSAAQFNANNQAYSAAQSNANNQGYSAAQFNANSQGYSAAQFNANSQGYRTLGPSSDRGYHRTGQSGGKHRGDRGRNSPGPTRGLFSLGPDQPPLLDHFSYQYDKIDWPALFQVEESDSLVLLRLIHLIGFASINANTAVSLYQQWHEGDGTYYGDQGEGSCQISSTDLPPAGRNADFLAALNVEQYMSSAACGMCFRVQGEGKGKGGDPIQGDFVVFVKDLCPICKAGDMDLAAKGDGRWDIRIQAVQCPVRDTYIQYWLQGSNAWYIKLQVRNTRVPCKEVEVQTKSGDWKELKLTRDGHWAGSARLNLAGDVPVRLTSITGATVQDIIPRLENQVVMEGKLRVQFPLESALPNA